MQIEALFFIIFLMISVHFGFSRATDCRENAISSSQFVHTITVDQLGRGDFLTVQKAVDSVPSGNDRWIRIHVNPGVYTEKVTIPKDKECIILEGSGYSQTIITWGDHVRTDSSATFTAFPDNFVAKGIAFKNSYNRKFVLNGVNHYAKVNSYNRKFVINGVNHYAKQNSYDRAFGLNGITYWAPAVAARIYGDKSAFRECAFLGFQDTLWDVQGRHYFKSCYIEGAVDFIWGGGQSLYEECSINVTAGLLHPRAQAGYITAQGRQSPADPSGFVFVRCLVSGSGQAYLGRAYGPFSRVIFYGTTLHAVVVPAGWDAWQYRGHEADFTFAEIGCRGPGADTLRRVGWSRKWLPAPEELHFSSQRFIDQDGWLDLQPCLD